MELSSRQDIEAPIDFVFEQVTDFTAFERQALRRGASVRRTDRLAGVGSGMAWDVSFTFRGKERRVAADLRHYDAPNGYTIGMVSAGLSGETVVDLVSLSRKRTRLTVQTRMAANGLTARLLLQSLKLARAKLVQRMSGRIEAFARDVEDRFARQS